MRIYSHFGEALNEIERDLAEMGINVTTQTMQDKERPEGFATLELQNYIYTVLNPDTSRLNPTQPWADAELMERLSCLPYNPGKAWKLRAEIWEHFLEKPDFKVRRNEFFEEPRFSYTYPERMYYQLLPIISELRKHPDSRQLFLSVWDPNKDITRLGVRRVPCTLGYYFQKRKGKLNMTYLQRSADFKTHFHNDLYLAVKLLEHVAENTNSNVGTFTHWVGSLHVYKDQVAGVF